MIVDLPETSTSAINAKMLALRDGFGTVLNRVMNLIVVIGPGDDLEKVAELAKEATREHPCRVIVLIPGWKKGEPRLDAQIRVGGDAGASEIIVTTLSGGLAAHADAVVVALLLADTPVVAWWPGDAPDDPGSHPIGKLAQRRLVDAARSPDPVAKLYARAPFSTPQDTDLGWARLTRWRSVLAAALDQPPYAQVTEVTVTGSADSPSNELLAAWLGLRLQCPVNVVHVEEGNGVKGVRLVREGSTLDLVRPSGNIAVLTQEGRADQRVALARRDDRAAIAEELRRLDPDDVFAEVMHDGLKLVKDGTPVPEAHAEETGLILPEKDAVRRLRSATAKKAATKKTAATKASPQEPDSKDSRPKDSDAKA